MSFLQPLMLAGLIGALVPIIIHLIHKRKPRKQPFAAIEFVLRSVQRVQRRWRLRRFLLLASRVLLLAALAIAAARPIIGKLTRAGTSRSGPERLAIVIDSSLSMRARHKDGRSAFSEAIAQARNAIESMGAEDQATVIVAAHKAEAVVEKPTGHRADLLSAIDKLQPTYTFAELSDAIRLAVASAAPPPPANPSEGQPASQDKLRVLVLTDMAGHGIRSSAELEYAGGVAALEIVDVLEDIPAKERVNHSITALEVVNVPGLAPRSVEARVRIRAFAPDTQGAEPVPADITLRSTEKDLYAGSVDIVAGTVVDKTLGHSFDKAGFVPVSVSLEEDALSEDDIRYGTADVRREVRVLIVDGAPSGVPKEDEIFYLERALAAGAQDQPPPRVITADDLARTELDAFDVVVLAGVPTLGREDGTRLTAFVQRGGGLLICASDQMDVEAYNRELNQVLPRAFRGLKIAAQDVAGSAGPVGIETLDNDHAIMSVFVGPAQQGLQTTRTRGYVLLRPDTQKPARVLAAFDGGAPMLVEGQFGRGTTLVLTTSIDRELSDLAIRPAFLPLVRRVILHLGGALSRPPRVSTLAGEKHVVPLPEEATGALVIGPDGQRWTIERGGEAPSADFPHTEMPGHYAVQAMFAGGPERYADADFAVNVDPRESDLRPVSLEEARAVLLGAGAGTAESPQTSTMASLARRSLANPERLAAWLLMVMLVAFLVESALTAQRKRTEQKGPAR